MAAPADPHTPALPGLPQSPPQQSPRGSPAASAASPMISVTGINVAPERLPTSPQSHEVPASELTSEARNRSPGVVSFVGDAPRVEPHTPSVDPVGGAESDDDDGPGDLTDPNRHVRPFVCPRTGEPLKVFCHTTRELTCLICPTYTHAGTKTELLRDFCARESQRLIPKNEQVSTLKAELTRLREQVRRRAERLHSQVDTAVADVIGRLNARRSALHSDIRSRSSVLMNTLEAELITRKEELQTLESAQLALHLLSVGRGVAPEGAIGGMLRGEMNYKEFLAIGDPALRPAPTIKETLKLNLPLQLRDEVLHFDWTAETRSLQPLVYPPKGF